MNKEGWWTWVGCECLGVALFSASFAAVVVGSVYIWDMGHVNNNLLHAHDDLLRANNDLLKKICKNIQGCTLG